MARKTVCVTGDVVLDQHIYKGARAYPRSPEAPGTCIHNSRGGAHLLCRLVDAVLPENEVNFGLRLKPSSRMPSQCVCSALWEGYPLHRGEKKERVWRTVELLGYGDAAVDCAPVLLADAQASSDILVIDDAGLGFRFCSDLWPQCLREQSAGLPAWVVLKMAYPVAQGDVWNALLQTCRDRLVVIVSAGDLRLDEVRISRGSSWEQTVQDLMGELQDNPVLRELAQCRHLVITFRSEGALWVENAPAKRTCRLVFDAGHLEGEWDGNCDGEVLGRSSCFVAGIVRSLVLCDGGAGLQDGIADGLAAMRALKQAGHGPVGSTPGFPLKTIAGEMTAAADRAVFSVTEIRGDAAERAGWSILADRQQDEDGQPLYGPAVKVARYGLPALAGIPHARFGKLLTVDRTEIEGLKGIQRLISDYVRDPRPGRPLSLAVFGPPGSGKSFGVKQIARQVLGSSVSILEFNLSQFTDPEMLTGAFHQVRDEVLKGGVPVVFWDEFDSRQRMWLQYLLAPMQDGAFLEGQITHPVGKCVFVFAGGTSCTMEQFTPPLGTDDFAQFTFSKGPDFVSRLRGYLNVLGPNPRQTLDRETGKRVPADDPPDICFPVRRAILLRGMLGLKDGEELQADDGLVGALLRVSEYTHGARSMETLIQLTRGPQGGTLRRSKLPPANQIALHVDYAKFTALIACDQGFKKLCAQIAPEIHGAYLENTEAQKVPYRMAFEQLPYSVQKDNHAAAARIPEVLALVGLKVVPADASGEADPEKTAAMIEQHIEMLAEAEHNGWMEYKRLNDWTCSPVRNDARRQHPCLVPYRRLDETDKDKDRNAVRKYPEFVSRAGYKIVPER